MASGIHLHSQPDCWFSTNYERQSVFEKLEKNKKLFLLPCLGCLHCCSRGEVSRFRIRWSHTSSFVLCSVVPAIIASSKTSQFDEQLHCVNTSLWWICAHTHSAACKVHVRLMHLIEYYTRDICKTWLSWWAKAENCLRKKLARHARENLTGKQKGRRKNSVADGWTCKTDV